MAQFIDFRYIEPIQSLIQKEQYSDALVLINTNKLPDQLKSMNNDNQSYELGKKIIQSELLVKLGKYSPSIELIKEIKSSPMFDNNSHAGISLGLIYSELLFKTGEYDESLKIIDSTIQRIERVHHIKDLSILADIKKQNAKLLNMKGNVFWSLGEFDPAIELYEKSLKLYNKIGSESGVGATLHNLGLTYRHKGELSKALEFYKQAINIFIKLGKSQTIGTILNNVGVTYSLQGYLDEALEYFEKSLKVFTQIGKEDSIASRFENIGIVYYRKNQLDLALKYLKKALSKMSKTGNKISISQVLFYIILVLISKGNKREQETYMERLEKINDDMSSKLVNIRRQLAQALILKSTGRLSNIVESQLILEDLLLLDNVNYELKTITMISICEIYVMELHASENQEIIDQLGSLIDQLLEVSFSENSNYLLVETLIIKSKFLIIKDNLEDGLETLFRALSIAKENKFNKLISKIDSELIAINMQVNPLKHSSEKSSAVNRIEMLKIKDYLEELKKLLL